MQGYGRIIAHDFCVAHREANSGLSTLNRTKSILSIYHQQRQLQKQRGMCLNDTYPLCQQPLSDNCHSICFSKPVLWTATPRVLLFLLPLVKRRKNIKGAFSHARECPFVRPIQISILTPCVSMVMMQPAMTTPRKMTGAARFKRILSTAAMSAPVHAPVPGSGMATNSSSPHV